MTDGPRRDDAPVVGGRVMGGSSPLTTRGAEVVLAERVGGGGVETAAGSSTSKR